MNLSVKQYFLPLSISLILASVFTSASYAQTEAVPLQNKELAINLRSLWFGGTASLIYRTPLEDNRFKRKVLTVGGNYNENSNALTNIPGTPQRYRSNSNGFFSAEFEIGRERRHNIIDQMYLYHGPAGIFSLSYSNTKSVYNSGEFIYETKNSGSTAAIGVGYFGGAGFEISERFSIQVENLIQLRASVRLANATQTKFDMVSRTETTENTITDNPFTSLGIPGINQSRIWIVFKF